MSDTPIRRREVLGVLGGAATALAGCVGAPATDQRESDRRTETATRASTESGIELPVPKSDLERGAGWDAIPAITNPVFGQDWSGVELEIRNEITPRQTQTIQPRLRQEDPIVGILRGGVARAYPFRILNYHEIVNDELDGPFLVSYCPLCRTALTAERTVAGEVTRFGVSGYLYQNGLVMYDEQTESLWSQVMALAIRGERTGRSLELAPVTLTTWGAWRRDHPETEVLRPPPESGTIVDAEVTRDYRVNPYAVYQDNSAVGISGSHEGDRLPPKAEVLGISHDGVSRAYPTDIVTENDPIEDTIGGLRVVVTTTPDGTPVAWERTVRGAALSFEAGGDRYLRAGGSRWTRTTGRALDGPYEGVRLEQANTVSPLFWFAWLDFHPETELYGQD